LDAPVFCNFPFFHRGSSPFSHRGQTHRPSGITAPQTTQRFSMLRPQS
jgi:hypothetical protein